MTARATAARRGGFTLIEVVVAMVLMAIVLTMLAAFSLSTATQMVKVSQGDIRQAVTLRELNRLAALPYASLAGEAGCRTVSVANMSHTACVTVTTDSLVLVVTPARAGLYPDTVVLHRVAATAYNPLDTE